MSNSTRLQKIMAISPNVEMLVRTLYRSKLGAVLFKQKVKPKSKSISTETKEGRLQLAEIKKYLKKIGVKKGDILIVHSAFAPFKNSGLSPENIIDFLIELIGHTGTLVMPVIRKYIESPAEEDTLHTDISGIEFLYDVQKTPVWTGILPKTLMKKEGAVTSRFPINTITALGADATRMIEHELDGEFPTPNGVNSAWKYCTDNNAWVISLGVDLTHSLTMIHTAEDVLNERWPVKGWYREKSFRIVDKDIEVKKTVLERHPRWGMLHFGERTLCKDLIGDRVMTSVVVDGVTIESLKSKELFEYLNKKNKNGYPYFWVNKYLKK